MKKPSFYLLSASLPLLLAGSPIAAQSLTKPHSPPVSAGDAPQPANEQEVTFAADNLSYDSNANIVVATGNVRMLHQGNRLRADRVEWNQDTDVVHATGNVAVVNSSNDTVYGDSITLTDALKDGMIENLLLVLNDGGRLVAVHGVRKDDVSTLTKAVYTPCTVLNSHGCPKEPMWKISAIQVVHDPVKHRISYKDARISLLGVPILWLPGLSHPDGSGGGNSGILLPVIQFNRTNGAELGLPYYFQLAPNRDLTVTPRIYSKVLPALQLEYRDLGPIGAWQAAGMITDSSATPATLPGIIPPLGKKQIRGYIDANGRFQLGPDWTLTGSLRGTTDRTFERRYNISNDDRLRNEINAEHITPDSYLSIKGWAVQTLRAGDPEGQQAIALPAIDYRRRITDPLLGGEITLQANSLDLVRTEGQDTQRVFAGAQWDLRKYTPLGQEITFTAYGRADLYHTSDVNKTNTIVYRGDTGWTGRGIFALAADMQWPFIGSFLNGSQRITPRVQIVAAPRTRNLDVPNEDSRSVDLTDSNLFALNRFSGYDRWEDDSRITYAVDWAVDLPGVAFNSEVGQSYGLSNKPSLLPDGTGLSDRRSDIVGHTSFQYGRFIEITDSYRLDKTSLSVRVNELDATIGSTKTYVVLGYLRLNRNITNTIEDLRDREEMRLGGRIAFARYWSVFGSTTVDLTGHSDDPLTLSDGYQPIRSRAGILYDDDCIELGVTWQREYERIGDARAGSTFLFRVALKNLGR